MVDENEEQTDEDRDDEFEGSEKSNEWDVVDRERKRSPGHQEDDDRYGGY